MQPAEFEAARDRLGPASSTTATRRARLTYAGLLWSADVVLSTAIHEFFGVSVVEAMYCGARPVLPARLSYPELLPERCYADCLYDDFEGLLARLRAALRAGREETAELSRPRWRNTTGAGSRPSTTPRCSAWCSVGASRPAPVSISSSTACAPRGPCPTANSTNCPARGACPSRSPDLCRKTSAPSTGVMKPYPFPRLYHLTTPRRLPGGGAIRSHMGQRSGVRAVSHGQTKRVPQTAHLRIRSPVILTKAPALARMFYVNSALAALTPTQLTPARLVRGDVAKWQGRGLQNPDRRFKSGRRLQKSPALQSVGRSFCF